MVQERELDVEHGRLERIQAAVDADARMVVARTHAVAAEQPQAVGQIVGLRGQHAAVAGPAEVLRRIEAEAADGADGAHAAAVDLRADRLGGVFHDRDAPRPGDLGQGHGVDRLAEQVDGDDGLRGRRDQRGNVLRVDIERLRIDVGKDRPRAQPRDRAGRGEKREAGQDHLVARGNVQGHQGQQQGVAARGAADGVLCLAVAGHLLFELRDLRAEHESAAIADPSQRGEDFRPQCRSAAVPGPRAERPGWCRSDFPVRYRSNSSLLPNKIPKTRAEPASMPDSLRRVAKIQVRAKGVNGRCVFACNDSPLEGALRRLCRRPTPGKRSGGTWSRSSPSVHSGSLRLCASVRI